MDHFYLLRVVSLNLLSVVYNLHESVSGRYAKAVLRVWEEHPHVLRETLHAVRLNEMHVGIVRFHDTPGNFPFFPGIHQVGHVLRVVPFNFFFILLFVELPLLILIYLLLLFN